MFRRNREVKRVPGSESERVLIHERGGFAELPASNLGGAAVQCARADSVSSKPQHPIVEQPEHDG